MRGLEPAAIVKRELVATIPQDPPSCRHHPGAAPTGGGLPAGDGSDLIEAEHRGAALRRGVEEELCARCALESARRQQVPRLTPIACDDVQIGGDADDVTVISGLIAVSQDLLPIESEEVSRDRAAAVRPEGFERPERVKISAFIESDDLGDVSAAVAEPDFARVVSEKATRHHPVPTRAPTGVGRVEIDLAVAVEADDVSDASRAVV